MKLDQVLKSLAVNGFKPVLATEWDLSEKGFPDQALSIIDETKVREQASWAAIDDDMADKAVVFSSRLKNDLNLLRLFWHEHHLLYQSRLRNETNAVEFPDLQDFLGDDYFKFNLCLVLSGIPQALNFHRSKGVPEEISRTTMGDIGLWVKHIKTVDNIDGLTLRIVKWSHNYLKGNMYQLGRLQFISKAFSGELYAFRNKNSSKVIALSQGGIKYNGIGLRSDENDSSGPDVWTSIYEYDDTSVAGHLISPDGYAHKSLTNISLEEWKKVLEYGDPILDIHIPSGGGMSPEICAASMHQASEFFMKYFPERKFKGFTCKSWFLEPRLKEVLRNDSNIISFQQSCYLFPALGSREQMIKRIFGEDFIGKDNSELPRDNSLRKAIAAYLEKGGSLKSGACFFLKEDLPWRQGVYQ